MKFQFEFTVMFNLKSLSCFIFRDINKIDDLMQDITEQQDVAREISEAISGPFGEAYDEVDTFLVPLSKSAFTAFTVFFLWAFFVAPAKLFSALQECIAVLFVFS